MPSTQPSPRVLLQIVEQGGEISVLMPERMTPTHACELLIKVLPEVWEQAKRVARTKAQAPVIVRPSGNMVSQLRQALGRGRGKKVAA